jgi:hypothetical protein
MGIGQIMSSIDLLTTIQSSISQIENNIILQETSMETTKHIEREIPLRFKLEGQRGIASLPHSCKAPRC